MITISFADREAGEVVEGTGIEVRARWKVEG
jgi:hypothetical protein